MIKSPALNPAVKPAVDPQLTAVIIAKNEAEMIGYCLDTLWWCSEVLVIDSGSSDQTAKIAEKAGARVISFAHQSMAKLRNEALKQVKTKWVFYVDADERVTPTLAKEIMVQLETEQPTALMMRRQSIHYGQIMRYGGWQNDQVVRVFSLEHLQGWVGKVHESPQFNGQAVGLHAPLIHLTHRNTLAGLKKSIAWTPIEAELLYKADAPPVKFFTIVRKGVMEFLRRALLRRGYKDGQVGWIESLVQGINRSLVYLQLWEKQQKPPIDTKYKHIEAQIGRMWQDEI
jgi:glycosyltransferase involved in cell wall biosynthesis